MSFPETHFDNQRRFLAADTEDKVIELAINAALVAAQRYVEERASDPDDWGKGERVAGAMQAVGRLTYYFGPREWTEVYCEGNLTPLGPEDRLKDQEPVY